MKTLSLIRLAAGSCALVALSAASLPSAAAGFTTIYAFGDSLTDNGNFFAASGGTYPPAPNYAGRFSNGPVAVEYLAYKLGATLQDYAYGGAGTGAYNVDLTPAAGPLYSTGLLSQVAGFMTAPPAAAASSQSLYFVWAGANDFLHGNPADYGSIAMTAIGNLETAVIGLYQTGARNFLLPLMPDLGATPSVRAYGATAAQQVSSLSLAFDQYLASAYQQLSLQLPGSHFTIFDTFAAQSALLSFAQAFGITNTTDACLTAAGACANPGSYFYWDDVHPTTLVHEVLGAQMAAAVPEPQTMLMMACGLLALLGVSRRRGG